MAIYTKGRSCPLTALAKGHLDFILFMTLQIHLNKLDALHSKKYGRRKGPCDEKQLQRNTKPWLKGL
jgi:hypothetical protein